MKFLIVLNFLYSCAVFSSGNWPRIVNGIDMVELEEKLQTDGIEAWVHGANPHFRQFVVTYRGQNFFKYVNLSLVPKGQNARAFSKTLRRHDKILIKGRFLQNDAPFPHISTRDITLIKKYEPKTPLPRYKHRLGLPNAIMGKETLTGKVHAIFNDGKALVIELGDLVLPVVAGELGARFTKDLYRNDFVTVAIKIQDHPSRPSHLVLNREAEKPVVVHDRMVVGHGDEIVYEGSLAMFPKSPQIKFNIFALKVDFPKYNTERNYTMVNFEDPEFFMEVLNKLQTVWDEKSSSAFGVRNHFVNPNIRLRVRGPKNVVSPSQANPQFIINSLDQIEVL